MIDSHIHILPGIDDGAADNAVSIQMAKVAIDDGIHSLICTPHDLNSVYKNTRKSILECTSTLQQTLSDAGIEIKIYPGAELHIDSNLVTKVMEGDAITLADQNKHVLIEFPKHLVPYGTESILENLLYNNLTPIIAHPERNPVIASSDHILKEWTSWGCKSQLTAMSVTGQFGSALQTVSKQWCQQGLVHIIASDAHRPNGRSPKLALAHQTISQWLGAEAADILLKTNPRQVIDGEELLNIPVQHSDAEDKKSGRCFFNIFSRTKRAL